MESRTITITLELRVGADDEVHGRAVTRGHGTRPFAGWIGLIGALDACLAPPAPEAACQGDQGA